MHTKINKNMLEQLMKMVPKWSQNLSKIDPGGGLEATWEPPLKQGASKTSLFYNFGSILGPPLGPFWGHFGHMFFLCFFEVAFWWPWPPFGLPKDLQNETQKGVKTKTWQSGVLKIVIFCCFFGVLFWDGFLEAILVILAHFWGPFWRPFWSLFGYHFCIDF